MISASRRSLARANAAAGLLLLVVGGLVTSTSSGLAVPDWPLSFGGYFPRMAGGVLFEHGHRVFAGLVATAILAMAVLTEREETRPGARALARLTAAGVLLQALLGGAAVLLKLPVAVSAAHATLGQTVFVLLILLAESVGEEPAALGRPAGALPAIGLAAVLVVWLQLVLGAVLRHGGAGLRWHALGALAASAMCAWFAGAVVVERREPSLREPAVAALVLLGAQLLLGASTAGLRLLPDPRSDARMVAVATIHLAVGALLLAALSLLAFRIWRGRSP